VRDLLTNSTSPEVKEAWKVSSSSRLYFAIIASLAPPGNQSARISAGLSESRACAYRDSGGSSLVPNRGVGCASLKSTLIPMDLDGTRHRRF